MVGPVILNQDLRKLPYVAAKEERDEQVLMRYPHGTQQTGTQPDNRVSGLAYVQQLLKSMWRPTPTIPAPILTFDGGAAAQFCACAPPDSDGDVGPNHYVEAINSAFAVYSKTGTLLAGPIRTIHSLPPWSAHRAKTKTTATLLYCTIMSPTAG